MFLSVEHLKVKAADQLIVKDLSFILKQGSALAIIGPSGSGKTTLVKTILGLSINLKVTGNIHWGDQIVQQDDTLTVPLSARKFGYIPQDLALWPHLTVKECLNLARFFTRSMQKETELSLASLTSLFGLNGLENSYPSTLSGGEKQRLALARALVGRPELLVLDEPFSALDVVAKQGLIELVDQWQKQLSFSTIFISHDLLDAYAIGQQILVMEEGRLVWFGERNELKTSHFSPTWNPLLARQFSSMSQSSLVVDYKHSIGNIDSDTAPTGQLTK